MRDIVLKPEVFVCSDYGTLCQKIEESIKRNTRDGSLFMNFQIVEKEDFEDLKKYRVIFTYQSPNRLI